MQQNEAEGTTAWQAQLDEITGSLESLADAMDREDSLDTLLHRVCDQVLRAIPDVDMAGVTLETEDGPKTGACTDETTFEVDLEQYRAGAGPCLHAAESGEIVRVDAEGARQRWPEFAAAARRLGVGSYLSAPLFIDSEYRGALNLYSSRDHGYRELDETVLELYTTAVEGHLRTWQRYLATRRLTEQLRTALDSRPVIDQAKGILMVLHGYDADQAFSWLVKQSQNTNTKLRDAAERIVSETVTARSNGTSG
ncbi:GAF and ANTAR domain-containing protein [Saccharopolyspora gloriosae]|uniref:GAF domain-containing protein n=1 Tax=Saccharopolyspora gloriosae TaxID=455344 RepID=A0A840NJ98_9PSEU|nr:ANTAR domain-containing protein [Saccharopolyspora gloriosae]MBB5071950.1 GAF domain-containing protein [Saccharopolyspora gloriosae]